MKSDKSLSDSVSKYYNLKTKISLSVKHKLTSWLMCAWNVSYQDRNGEAMGYRPDEKKFFSTPYEAYWIIDGSLRCSYRFFEIFTEISNLTNTHYIDAGSRLQPGRWGKVGISVKI
jgi:iron complex outermembrane receptor protein